MGEAAAGDAMGEDYLPGVRGGSKTLDLLMDVALPVSVSFGKTSLEIREVLKLNTGSVVELDRLISEPVEVIVNNCVIARGEVVVVDGNYGVRVTHLASRADRMRSGMMAVK
jgi:flagellar motor switch protein FliN/FliY